MTPKSSPDALDSTRSDLSQAVAVLQYGTLVTWMLVLHG